jgi:cyclopropane-fatty-acyl-phospholipid synthase
VLAGILIFFLTRLIQVGKVELRLPNGSRRLFGDGTGPHVAVAVHDSGGGKQRGASALIALISNPNLALGELYMNGWFDVIEGDLYDLLETGAVNLARVDAPGWLRAMARLRRALRRWTPFNDRLRARRNVAHHYDLDERLYALFLDSDLQYSCAYFDHPSQPLEGAQLAKKRHIAAKLLIGPGQRVLDIGCGFGGLALYLARVAGARVTGITLSQSQFAAARRRVADAGLSDRIDIRLQDFRDVDDSFDRIVSVGMFEHVGLAGFDEFFSHAKRLMVEDGVMLLHAIGRNEPPRPTHPWMEKYIFPGSYVAPVSEVSASIERAGLRLADIEILRIHYADTLKAWRRRFLARREEAKAMYDERFCRMWEFYLAGAEISFRAGGHMVYQFQLAKRQDIVPTTRDYVGESKRRLRDREIGLTSGRSLRS